MAEFQRFAFVLGIAGLFCIAPTLLAIQPMALQLGAFGETSFVLDDSGILWAWGSNRGSQFGDGGTNSSLNGIPIPLPGGVDAWMQFAGGSAFAAIDSTGRIFGWGQSEADHNGFDLPIQRVPTLIDAGAWSSIAVTTARSGVNGVPWALATTVSGELRWIRVPLPSIASSPPFSARFTEPAQGVDGAGAFLRVEAGDGFFLAMTDNGRVFAAGVGTSGCLGPSGDLKSTLFNKTFQEVLPPEPGMTWTRIAATDGQAFAWSTSNDLYIWGRRFDIDEGWIIDPIPRKVPRPPGGSVWADVKGANGTTLLLTGVGDIYAAATDATGWVARYGTGRDVLRERSRLTLPGSWRPIRTLSACPSHMLLQGADGRLRALGYNDSLQLGALTDDPEFQYPPVIPGGNADFLLGRDADVPILSLGQNRSEIIEPVDGSGTGGTGVDIQVLRTGPTSVPTAAKLAVTVLHPDGSPVPDAASDGVLKDVIRFSRDILLEAHVGEGNLPLTPLFAPDSDEDYRIRIVLVASPTYESSDSPELEFTYRHSTALNVPPKVTQLWPPANSAFFAEDSVFLRFEVLDKDGYPTNAVLNLQGPGPKFRQEIALAPTPPNSPQILEFKLPVSMVNWWNLGVPSLRVEDNLHGIKQIKLPAIVLSQAVIPRVTLRFHDRTMALSMNAREGELVLEGSTDLKTWTPLKSFLLPPPADGNLDFSVDLDFTPHRFFRLVDPVP